MEIHPTSLTTHCISDITDAHNKKEKRNLKKKVPLQQFIPSNSNTKHHQKSITPPP
jgi:hypothetical protein